MFLSYQGTELKDKQRMETISYASLLRARTERELSSLLYLNSGLGSYLVVRNKNIKAKEVNDILAVLHRSSRHIRNFGVALGYRLTFVYPLKGNESAIGLYYPDQPAQWPVIKKITESGKPALAGPVQLVQGGSGLIYRVPLSIAGKHWGLLSTVIDTDSFFKTVSEELGDSRFEFAVRGKDGEGLRGDMVWGDRTLFERKQVFVQEIEIPGGSWAIGVKPRDGNAANSYALLVRLLSATLGGIISWMLYLLIRNRADLADLAMYDQLTGLPNRHLFEDRVRMAFARLRRSPDRDCALLFLDLDGFKGINDKFGHKAGDAVLTATAKRARAIVRQNDTVARWGGDEFIILMESVTRAAMEAYIHRLRVKIESPIDFEHMQLRVGVSIGFVISSETTGDLDEMLKLADQRMYEDKSSRK
ncbi:MAG: sensor domain-containing diguanylate cyclase [Nitrosomonadales bacterium]|nr:sensor domain-containing diguanylate cyclase [Nitrosomonadales bacterium]